MHDVYYFTDIHGQLDLFHSIINWCIKQDPECMIIYGGDAADRGEDGYQIIKELLDNPQVVYLYGNHEDLFIKAADEIIGHCARSDEDYARLHSVVTIDEVKGLIIDYYGDDVSLHINNGGYPTLRDWILDGADEEIVDRLRTLPRTFRYENIDFCHAGGSPNCFDRIYQQEHDGITLEYNAEQMCIWDRNSIPLGWTNDRICVFGHTPVISLSASIYGSRDKSMAYAHPAAWQDHMGAKHKRNGWKIDMDTAATWSGRAYVLNVLTMIATGFYDPKVVLGESCGEPIQEAFENYKLL